MRSEFEEKTYESYFNSELGKLTNVYFPLGQVQEGSLGFDSSAYSKSRKLWRILGSPFLWQPNFEGYELREIADEMERVLGIHIKSLPEIKINILFQYKKPEYITSKLGKEWNYWNEPYYRYDIYDKQQDLLMKINSSFHDGVLLLYASPAMYKIQDLILAYKSRKVIKYSNFKKVGELNSHHRNTYIKAGNYSIACSESEKIKNYGLLELLEGNYYNSKESNNKFIENSELIIKFVNQIVFIMNESDDFGDSFKILNDEIEEFRRYKLLHSFLVMRNFRRMFGTQWMLKL